MGLIFVDFNKICNIIEKREFNMKFKELRNGINMYNMHLFMALVSVAILVIHIFFLFLMKAAGAGAYSYFNVFSILVYMVCFFLFYNEKFSYQAYVIFFSEIFLFSTLMTWCVKYYWGFCSIVTPLIPLIGLLGFMFKAKYKKRNVMFYFYSLLACLVFGINTFKSILRPEIGFIELRLSYQMVLTAFCCGIEALCMGVISTVSCAVAQSKDDEQNFKIEKLSLKLFVTLSQTVEAKDKYTNGHSIRVASYAQMIAAAMGLPPEEQKKIYFCGLLHDIGKISIPDSIINKAGKLDDDEYREIKNHSVSGWNILHSIDEFPELSYVARWHHERYDGRGYPDGKKEDETPLFVRIVSIADAYDAMTSNRSYRKLMDREKVLSIIEEEKGKQFDPAICDVFLKILAEDTNYDMRQKDSEESKMTVTFK